MKTLLVGSFLLLGGLRVAVGGALSGVGDVVKDDHSLSSLWDSDVGASVNLGGADSGGPIIKRAIIPSLLGVFAKVIAGLESDATTDVELAAQLGINVTLLPQLLQALLTIFGNDDFPDFDDGVLENLLTSLISLLQGNNNNRLTNYQLQKILAYLNRNGKGYPYGGGYHGYPDNDHHDNENSGKSQYPKDGWGCEGTNCGPPRRPQPRPKPNPKPHPPKPWNSCKYCGLVQEEPEEFEHRGHHCKKICKWVPDHKWPWQNGKDEHSDVSTLDDEPDEEDEYTRLTEGADMSWGNPENTVAARQELSGFSYPRPSDGDANGGVNRGDESDDHSPSFGWKGDHHDYKKCPKFCKKKCWKKCWKPKPKSKPQHKPYVPKPYVPKPHYEAPAVEVATAFVTSVVTVTGSRAAPTPEPQAAVAAAPSEPEFRPAAALTPAFTAAEVFGVAAVEGCPETCNPESGRNRCDPTTSCTSTGGRPTMCACRAGYRLDSTVPEDFVRQIHVSGQPYVYVAPGMVCNTPCSDSTCTEVLTRDVCVR